MAEPTPPARPALEPRGHDSTPGLDDGGDAAAAGRKAFLLTLSLWVAGSVALGIVFVVVVRTLSEEILGDPPISRPIVTKEAPVKEAPVPAPTPPPPPAVAAPVAGVGDRILAPRAVSPQRTLVAPAPAPRAPPAPPVVAPRAEAPSPAVHPEGTPLSPVRVRPRPAPVAPAPRAADQPAGAADGDLPLPPNDSKN
jgi:hypothetical protein